MATKKAGKKATKKTTERKPIPYALIAKMVEGGTACMAIAQKVGRVNDGDDPTHTVRAIISGMRTRGWKDEQGKLRKLTVERIGQTKKKAEKNAGKKPAKKAVSKPTATTQPDGKTLAANG
jgi:hypothetical protein